MTSNHKDLLQLLSRQDSSLSRIYKNMSKELAAILKRYKITNSSRIWHRNKQVKKEVEAVLKKYRTVLFNHISNSSTDAWNLSEKHNDSFVSNYIKGVTVANPSLYYGRNTEALKAFLKRSSNGLNLSKRVWNLTNQAQSQLEYFIAEGLTKGRSATKLAGDINRYLKVPEKRFRRIRNPHTGKLMLSDPAKNYKPGTGVYRSSYKNALRLARNEINIAYRTADIERRKQLPFVVGITVHLSPAHPQYDICDELQGDYPKNFNFVGWHPNCLCFTTSKLLSKKDFINQLNGQDIPKNKFVNSIPDRANKYLHENADRIKGLSNTPYFIKDNFKNTKDGIALKKSIGVHVPYIPDKRQELVDVADKFSKDYNIVFGQKSEHRRSMMNNYLSKVKDREEPLLDLKEKAIIYGYTDNKIHHDLNTYLLGLSHFRTSSEYVSFLKSYKVVLKDSISKLPNYSGNVFRGVDLKPIDLDRYYNAWKNKGIVTEDYFASTSVNASKAFKKNTFFYIKCKSGKKIEHLSAFETLEEEVLLQYSSKYKVLKIYKKNGITHIHMEEV